MAPLVTLIDLQKRFGEEVVQDQASGPDGTFDQARVDQALADASAEVEGYLAGRYTLPLSAVPEIVERVACDLAWYYLHNQLRPADVKDRYERSLKLLDAISTGKVRLGLSMAGAEAQTVEAAEMHSSPTVFGRGRSGGFI